MHSLASFVLAVIITGTAGAPVPSKPMTERIREEKLVMAQHRIEPAPDPQVVQSASGQTPRNRWDVLAECESHGEWDYNEHSGWGSGIYDGGLQFDPNTWLTFGGSEFAPTADQATREQQIAIAERVLAAQGWRAWPACSRKLGWR